MDLQPSWVPQRELHSLFAHGLDHVLNSISGIIRKNQDPFALVFEWWHCLAMQNQLLLKVVKAHQDCARFLTNYQFRLKRTMCLIHFNQARKMLFSEQLGNQPGDKFSEFTLLLALLYPHNLNIMPS